MTDVALGIWHGGLKVERSFHCLPFWGFHLSCIYNTVRHPWPFCSLSEDQGIWTWKIRGSWQWDLHSSPNCKSSLCTAETFPGSTSTTCGNVKAQFISEVVRKKCQHEFELLSRDSHHFFPLELIHDWEFWKISSSQATSGFKQELSSESVKLLSINVKNYDSELRGSG